MQNINLQGGSFKKYHPRAEGPRVIFFGSSRLAGLYFAYRPMNRVIYDIFYGEIHLPSEHQVYMPYINLPALIGMLGL